MLGRRAVDAFWLYDNNGTAFVPYSLIVLFPVRVLATTTGHEHIPLRLYQFTRVRVLR